MKAITGARLIDGTGGAPLDNATVVVNGRLIEAAGPAGSTPLPEGSEVIDAAGKTMLPGLIDCHDHLAWFGYGLESFWGLTEPRSLTNMRVAAVLKRTLESGYTAVRDGGGLDAGFRHAVDEGLIPGPRLQVSLGFITPTGGMAELTLGSPSGYSHPGPPEPGLPSGVADGPEGMRANVREMVRADADVIKVAVTGGSSSRSGLGPNDMLITPKEIEALVDEAHRLKRRGMCHALGGPGLRAAVEAGVDSIEHGSYLDEDPDLLKIMADKDIYFTPTLSVYRQHAEKGSPHGRVRAAAMRDNHVRSIRMALEAGVRVVAGTDRGVWFHGNNAEELGLLVKAGMTPMQATVAATGDAARCLGLDGEIGTVEPGKKADLILVNGDPLTDVTILEEGRAVVLVMKDGQVYLDRRSTA